MKSLIRKLSHLNWEILCLIVIISMIGWAMLISAAGGSLSPWAGKQMLRFVLGMGVMLTISLMNIKWCLILSYPFYWFSFLLLCAVEVMGFVGMGAERWIDLYVIQIQPSELMKIALVLALARFFHREPLPLSWKRLVFPLFLILLPTAFVLRQPDLGTAMVLLMLGGSMLFLAGTSLWFFLLSFLGALMSAPLLWRCLYDYQKNRVLIFLDPSRDIRGTGYHITQSKIALGSGGLWGKGYRQGTQAALDFLPEKQTDSIFTLLCEEWGFMGGFFLLSLYVLLLIFSFRIVFTTQNTFGQFTAFGVTMTFFLYAFINIGMMMGLLPVVGVPLPLISYGGTAMLTLMMGFGLLLNVGLNRLTRIG